MRSAHVFVVAPNHRISQYGKRKLSCRRIKQALGRGNLACRQSQLGLTQNRTLLLVVPMHAWTVCCLPKLETSILPSKHARPMRGQVYLCQARGRRTLHCGCDFALSHHEKHRIKSICIEAGCSPGSQVEHGGAWKYYSQQRPRLSIKNARGWQQYNLH